MSTKHENLNAALPRCRYCQRYWQPEGVVASNAYCSVCSMSRRAIAAKQLGLKPLSQLDRNERYVLPVRYALPLRPKPQKRHQALSEPAAAYNAI